MIKHKTIKILAIESSCDDSAAAVVLYDHKTRQISSLSNIISSQITIHQKYGGVVPEIAAREHVLNILPVINEALTASATDVSEIAALAVTVGPGLITSLITGIETIRTLAFAWNKPVIEVNHIEGHIYANFINLTKPIKFPAIILTVSGGHTLLARMSPSRHLTIIGETRDDAAGEAYDKAAKMMNLGYPGGPIISKLAAKYATATNRSNVKLKYKPINLPRPMLHSGDFDFSFSGLKTALLYQLQKDPHWKKRIPAYCYEYQQAIIDILISKTLAAAKKYQAKTIMLSGGVSANTELRQQLLSAVSVGLSRARLLVPNIMYTTDNAAMIGAAAIFKYQKNKTVNYRHLQANTSLQL